MPRSFRKTFATNGVFSRRSLKLRFVAEGFIVTLSDDLPALQGKVIEISAVLQPKEPHHGRFLLRYGWFTTFLGAMSVSTLGDAILALALPWFAYDMTQSPAVMATVFFAERIPFVVFYPIAGVIVDKFSKRRLLILTELLRALLVGLLPLLHSLGVLQMWHIFAVAPLLTALGMLYHLILNSITPLLMPKAEMPTANSCLQSVSTISQLIGPFLAGAIIAGIGAVPALFVDSISFLATLAVAFKLRLEEPKGTPMTPGNKGLRVIFEGFHYIIKHRVLLTFAGLSFVSNFAHSAMKAMLVFVLRSQMQLDANLSGLVFSTLGLSSLVGASLTPRISRLPKGIILPVSQAISCVGILLFGMATTISGALVAAFVYAGPLAIYNIVNQSLRQEIVPVDVLGRATSAYLMIAMISSPLSAFFSGPLGERLGVSTMLVLIGLLPLVASIAVALSPIRRAV